MVDLVDEFTTAMSQNFARACNVFVCAANTFLWVLQILFCMCCKYFLWVLQILFCEDCGEKSKSEAESDNQSSRQHFLPNKLDHPEKAVMTVIDQWSSFEIDYNNIAFNRNTN